MRAEVKAISAACATEIAALSDPAPSVVGEYRFTRFLRAKKGDVDAATKEVLPFPKHRVDVSHVFNANMHFLHCENAFFAAKTY